MGKAKNLQNKAEAEAAKEAAARAAKEKQAAAEWSVGANTKAASRQADEASKADEAARKRREKQALLAEEEANISGAGSKIKKTPTLSKKKGKKDDLSMLEDALVSGAEKKQKAKKEAERKKAERLREEEQKRKEAQEAAEAAKDPLLSNTEDMIRGTTDDLVGRNANKALDEENAVSGIDGALQGLGVGDADGTKGPSMKALYKAFEERMLPGMKEDYPSLKLSQYKDKIFQAWKKSPENPANQQP
jgi:Coiled-coil domain-containing protein 124 /Oxs1